jgi:hypothetical protein
MLSWMVKCIYNSVASVSLLPIIGGWVGDDDDKVLSRECRSVNKSRL